jgi:diguanylate cyclase (GGDEF)-like protein
LEDNYQVICTADPEEGLLLVRKEKPDLVILDVVMPKISGFEVCRILRASESNNLMPIIMLTADNDTEKKLIGLELGADDYITKPFDEREMRSRIRNTLKRIERNRAANPLTGLSGNLEIQREILSRIARKDFYAVVYADIDNFKAYNDVYGFEKGDLAIKMTADIIVDQVRCFGAESDFIGHIGGDDFIFVTLPQHADEICRNIIEQFDEKIKELYSSEDIKTGFISTRDRKGRKSDFGLMSLSLAVITNEHIPFTSYEEVAKAAASLKKKVKNMSGSNYVIEQRKTIR